MSPVDHDLPSRVAAHPFLAGMNEPQMRILADCAEAKCFEVGAMIFRAGDPARGFYLLESGSIAVEGDAAGGATVAIDTVAAGEPLGWSWIFEPFVCQYGARALEPTTAIFFDALRLAEHRGADLTLGHELFKRMSQVMVRRLNAARAKLLEATIPDR
ncbi:MAG: Crp/Fnr family transcriptional regulator [Chthoniobacterales bacterium]